MRGRGTGRSSELGLAHPLPPPLAHGRVLIVLALALGAPRLVHREVLLLTHTPRLVGVRGRGRVRVRGVRVGVGVGVGVRVSS